MRNVTLKVKGAIVQEGLSPIFVETIVLKKQVSVIGRII